MADMNRRDFVAAAATTCAACICGSSQLIAAAAEEKKAKPLDVGDVKDFPTSGIYDKSAGRQQLFVIRDSGRLYAVSGMCSHKGFALIIDKDNRQQLKCNKHGSLFSLQGLATKGPAKTPLTRYAITLDDRKHVIVDTSRQFVTEKEWANPAAFVKVEAVASSR